MRPNVRIEIDGQPAGDTLMGRVQRCEVRDKDGGSADTVTVDLADHPPAAIPRRGAAFRVFMGYGTTLAYMGSFQIEDIELAVAPGRMTITGKAAEMAGAAKTNRERSWEDATLGGIVTQIAEENGWRPLIDPALAAFEYDYFAQINESDLHFLRRLAGGHDAIASVKDGALIFAKRGTGTSPSGAELTPIVVADGGFLVRTCEFRSSDRTKYAKVVASWHDRATGERRDVEVVSSDEGTAVLRINERFGSEKDATEAATAKANELSRSAWQFRVRIPGNPAARAGAPLTFTGVRPGIDGLRFVIETAVHSIDKSEGYTTTLDGKLQE